MSEVKIGTLPDKDILSMCSEGTLIEESFDPRRIKQACYELRCGNIYYDVIQETKRYVVPEGENILLKPKQTIVIITMESLRLPPDTYADPGFSGRLGIVLHNLSNNYLKITPGDAIAKIEFSRLESAVIRPYEGQHGYQTDIWPIRNDMILDKNEIKLDYRIKSPHEELDRAYGNDLAKVIKRVFGYERKLLLFSSVYFLIMLILIGFMSGTNWLNTTIALIIGVGSNIITTIIILFVTSLRR
jgi:dCTP deaminase